MCSSRWGPCLPQWLRCRSPYLRCHSAELRSNITARVAQAYHQHLLPSELLWLLVLSAVEVAAFKLLYSWGGEQKWL